MSDIVDMTASELAERIRARELSAEEATRACLERIARREPTVAAWQHLDPEAALAAARARDNEPPRGPLHGVPFGVKDIFDTADMPTEYGSEIHRGHRPAADAASVAAARAAGVVVLGKTVTTEFATYRPPKTTNPHDAGHTPGGSSSGSAAAVADRMVPLAYGSQTVGSVIRPASFCGVVGFKATWGRFDLAGVHELAGDVDTLGLFARTVEDVALATAALEGGAAATADAASCRIGLCRTPNWDAAQTESREAVEDAARRFADAGHAVQEVELPAGFERLAAVHQIMFSYQAVRALADEWRDHRARLSAKLQEILEEGAGHTEADYRAAADEAARARAAGDAVFDGVDLLLAPSAPGEAPAGHESTGDPVFNRMWTLLHGPCLNLPGYRGPKGLPVGIQLIGRRGDDDRLLARGAALARHLPDDGRAAPPG